MPCNDVKMCDFANCGGFRFGSAGCAGGIIAAGSGKGSGVLATISRAYLRVAGPGADVAAVSPVPVHA